MSDLREWTLFCKVTADFDVSNLGRRNKSRKLKGVSQTWRWAEVHQSVKTVFCFWNNYESCNYLIIYSARWFSAPGEISVCEGQGWKSILDDRDQAELHDSVKQSWFGPANRCMGSEALLEVCKHSSKVQAGFRATCAPIYTTAWCWPACKPREETWLSIFNPTSPWRNQHYCPWSPAAGLLSSQMFAGCG